MKKMVFCFMGLAVLAACCFVPAGAEAADYTLSSVAECTDYISSVAPFNTLQNGDTVTFDVDSVSVSSNSTLPGLVSGSYTLIIKLGRTLTINSGFTLTIPASVNVIINGVIDSNGTIFNDGLIDGTGTIYIWPGALTGPGTITPGVTINWKGSGGGGGGCGIVVGLDGREAPGPVTGAWLAITYFAILLAPVALLQWRRSAKKRGEARG